MEVKPGYKRTDVGMIPEDWSVVPLGRLVRSVEYGSSAKSSTKGETPVLRMGNLQGGKIDWSDLVYTDNAAEISKYRLRPGDVLFNRTNTIDLVGKTSIYEGERPAIFAGYLIRINADPGLLDSHYLNYILNTEFARSYSSRVLSVAVGQANINGQKLKTYPIPLPPTLREQQAIAAALGDVDTLIASLDGLLAKKRDLKQAAMQQLLTGQTRLPGFSGEWDVKPFGQVVRPRGERHDPRRNGESEFCIELEHIESETGRLIGHAAAGERSSLKAVFYRGDILFGKLRAYLRKFWQSTCDGLCSTEIWVLPPNPKQIASGYLAQVVRLDSFVEAASTAYGTHMPRSDWNVVKNYPLRLPKPDEQAAVAEVLSDMDAEISALEERRDKTKLLKEGMMQELLTGKTRLL